MTCNQTHFTAVRLEVLRHLEDTETSKLAHWDAAAVYGRRHKYYIGLPALVMSLVLSWMLSSEAKTTLMDTGWVGQVVRSVPVVLSLLVSVLTGLGAFLNFNELAGKHRRAAENLSALWRDCKNWDTDFPDSSTCENAVLAVQGYRKRLNEINRESPQIPHWAWISVQRQREAGSTTYTVEQRKS